MSAFATVNGSLHAEGVALDDIAAEYGTPTYVYSRNQIEQNWRAYDDALQSTDHLICYAVKANSNLAILNLLARLGSGFDIVSGGELQRVVAAGGSPEKIVFSGVGKTVEEMQTAISAGILCFNVESISELQRLDAVAADMNCTAPVSIRINPDVDPDTHPYIATGLRENKFGIPYADALDVCQLAVRMDNLNLIGIDCHIGSQITSLAPYQDALEKLLQLVDELKKQKIALQHFDIGGGLGICYEDEQPPAIAELARLVGDQVGNGMTIMLEPGRSIVGNAGLLLTRVQYLKTNNDKHFAIVDAAMNDLLRPALYESWQEIVPVRSSDAPERVWDIVGPVCESGDFLGKARSLALDEGDLLAVYSAGAYSFSMSSNYNSRARAAEVLVDGDRHHLIRERESVAELFQGEHLLAD